MQSIQHLPLLLTLFISLTTLTTHALPTELIPVSKGVLWSWSWINGSFLGIPYIYLIAGAGGALILFIIIAVFFYFRKRREDRRYSRLVEESAGEGTSFVTCRGSGGIETGAGTGAANSGTGHVATYLHHERPLSQHSSQQQQHPSVFVGQAQPQMSEIRHGTVYYSEKAPIQIQTHDPVTGYPFPQGKVQFFELSINAATANNTVTSSPATERREIKCKKGGSNSIGDSKKEEEKTPVSLDQLPERLYSHPPPELHHKLSSLSVASTATLPVSTPTHVRPEGGGSEVGLKNCKPVTVAVVTQSQAKKNVSSSPAGSKDSTAKSKVQLKRNVSVSKNIKTKKATTTTTKPKPFT
ncbi:hypothetical protein F5H01DRAFT_380978 [Linnemannia elongata]|nr:hypothetical protein F5H01DRAFT_380978 [Linnemannia elongata]